MDRHLSGHYTRGAALLAAFALTSCGGGGGDEAHPSSSFAASRPVVQSDLEIAQGVYGGGARTPAGFHIDSTPPEHQYVATVHLKNNDVGAVSASDPLHELCTNDWNEALAWSESSAAQAPQYSALVATNDDARFFEFGRAQQSDPQFYLRERIFKCSYLDRSAADLRVSGGPAGRLNQRPVSADELKTLSEYLWQFTKYNNFGHVVLNSDGEATGAALTHTLHIGSLTRAGLSSTCDRIDVLAWRHSLNATTGSLELSVETLWSFGARESAGVAELCAG